MPMLFLLQQYQEIILTLLKKLFKKYLLYLSAFFTLRASQSHYIGFVVVHSRYTNTASWATSSPLQQSWHVNNPAKKEKKGTVLVFRSAMMLYSGGQFPGKIAKPQM
jgi:hypothetical protein